MRDSAYGIPPRFHFSLPRLIARMRGENSARAETSWWEAKTLGTFVHLIAFAFGTELILAHSGFPRALFLLLLLVLFLLIFWMIVFYLNSFLIRLLRAVGVFRGLSNSRAQTFLIAVMTSCFAIYLVLYGSALSRFVGFVWLIALGLNLLSAIALLLDDATS